MHQPASRASRREFVTHFAITSGALACGLNFPSTAFTASTPDIDFPRKLDLQVSPSPDEASGVICMPAEATYLIFNSIQVDEDNRQIKGTAVVELVGCCGLATAHPGSDLIAQPDRPRYFGELDIGSIYEVENSSWLAALDAKCRQMLPIEKHVAIVPLKKISKSGRLTFTYRSLSVTVPNPAYRMPSENARHFAFRFGRTTLHSVADDLQINFLNMPRGLILASLSAQK